MEFVTAPRSINKSDAASLISTFGSLQNAVNAQPEQISSVPGWGEKKVQQWCNAVREDFRVETTKKASAPASRPTNKPARPVGGFDRMASNEHDEDEAVLRAVLEESRRTAAGSLPVESPSNRNQPVEELDEGIAAALAKLRESGG